jgi:hypothetical protein
MSDYLEKLPLSVQQHLGRVNMLAERAANGGHVSQSEMHQAITALAQAAPELTGLLIASSMGKSTLSLTESNVNIETDRIVKKWLGITYQSETHTKTNQSTRRRDISLH